MGEYYIYSAVWLSSLLCIAVGLVDRRVYVLSISRLRKQYGAVVRIYILLPCVLGEMRSIGLNEMFDHITACLI